MASCPEKTCTLSTPSHFKKTSKLNLIPPSTYSNQTTTKTSSSTIKTPFDFTRKPSNTNFENENAGDGHLPPSKDTRNIKQQTSHVSNGTDNLLQSHGKHGERDVHNVLHLTGVKTQNGAAVPIKKLPPGLSLKNQSTRRTPDISLGNNIGTHEYELDDEQNESGFDNNENVSVGNDGTVSKKEYKTLENMYFESKNKLDNLEMKFFKIMKASGKQKLENSGKNENDYEEKLMKQVEAFKFQNEFLCDKLQKVDQGQYSDVKGAVDRYLSQNQFETEKVALNNQILEVERNLFEKNKENESLLKDIYSKDGKYEKAMLRNNEERYSYEECIVRLNTKITEMIDENEKLRNEKEDCLARHEESVKKNTELNQIIETKNKCINELSKKNDEEVSKNHDLNKMVEKQNETNESTLANVEKMLKEEVIINSNLQEVRKKHENHIKLLEQKLDEMDIFTHDLQHDNDQIKVIKTHLDLKCEEIIQLQSSCRTLQSTNETLSIRVNSLSEMLQMQEPYMKGFFNSGDKDKMLEMWREKVYSLLVLLKVQEMKTKHGTEGSYYDGSSTL